MERLTIENFRSFKDKISVDLTEINILTGPNNSGKSNILKFLILFSDYLSSKNHLVLSFNGLNSAKHKIDCYQNAINWSNWKTNKSLKFSYEGGNYILSFEFVPLINRLDGKKLAEIQAGKLYRFEMTSIKDRSRICIINSSKNEYSLLADRSIISELWESINTSKDDLDFEEKLKRYEQSELERIYKIFLKTKPLDKDDPRFKEYVEKIALQAAFLRNNSFRLKKLQEGKKKSLGEGQISISVKVPEDNESKPFTLPSLFHKILNDFFWGDNEEQGGTQTKANLDLDINVITRNLKRFLHVSIVHLNPDRSNQARIHLNSERTSEISRIIFSYKLNPFIKKGLADKFLIKWMKRLTLGNNYRFRNLEGIATAIEVKDRYGWHNLVDKGFGAGQIFSILIRIAEFIEKSPKPFFKGGPEFPSIIAIEEPEANLHPRFQSVLADIFMDAIVNSNVQFIIETHSEYLIRRFQYLVADKRKKLKNTDVKVSYFQDPDLKMTNAGFVYDLEMRPDGILRKDFGPGFFDEATRLTIELLKQQK
jgi:predicted ATP-dependent endonuclease of OLD family